jgi:hypothetical protein
MERGKERRKAKMFVWMNSMRERKKPYTDRLQKLMDGGSR